MSIDDDWADGFARQADADFRAWELYQKYPEACAEVCHKLLFLQMACEKLCKAHRIRAGADPNELIKTHRVVAKNLPLVIREEMIRRGQDNKAIAKKLLPSVCLWCGIWRKKLSCSILRLETTVSGRTTASTRGRLAEKSFRRLSGVSTRCGFVLSPAVLHS